MFFKVLPQKVDLKKIKGGRTPFRFPALSRHWQSFVRCLLVESLFPLIPLVTYIYFKKGPPSSSICMEGMVYIICISGTMQNGFLFLWSVFNLLIIEFAFTEGAARDGYALFWILGYALIHAASRYNRHVVDRQSFWLEQQDYKKPAK